MIACQAPEARRRLAMHEPGTRRPPWHSSLPKNGGVWQSPRPPRVTATARSGKFLLVKIDSEPQQILSHSIPPAICWLIHPPLRKVFWHDRGPPNHSMAWRKPLAPAKHPDPVDSIGCSDLNCLKNTFLISPLNQIKVFRIRVAP